jgi:signal transduction histidine kinase
MSEQPEPPFLLVAIDEAWRAERIDGPEWLFKAGEFAVLSPHLDVHGFHQAPEALQGRTLSITHVHEALPFRMSGLIWHAGASDDIPGVRHGLFLPARDEARPLASLDALFTDMPPRLTENSVHHTVLNGRGEVIAATSPGILHKATANAPWPNEDALATGTKVSCFRQVEGRLVETPHLHLADWAVRHSAEEMPLCDLRPLSIQHPEIATVLRVQLVNARALLKQSADIEHLLDLYKTMLWRVGHNIRTPLNAIYGFWQLHQMAHPDPSEQGRRRSDIVRDAIRQINQTIEDAASIPSVIGKPHPGDDHADLEASLQMALRMSKHAIDSKNILFGLSGPVSRVRASRQVLVEVFLNLVSNAVKFSPPHSQVSVAWAHGPTDNMLEVTFENQVEADQDDSIVHPNPHQRRLHQRSAVPGSGVGLATCAYLLRRLGGDLAPTHIAQGRARALLTLPLSATGQG